MLELSKQDILHEIAQDARRFMHMLPAPITPPGPPQKMYSHHRLAIPPPSPVTPLFLARGFDPVVAGKFNEAFLSKALSLKKMYEDKHHQVVKAWLDGGSLNAEYTERVILASHAASIHSYNQYMETWRSKMDEISRRRPQGTHRKQIVEGRPTFKNESIPSLEKIFLTNAYPSRADKELIAEETGMEYKQVNIWFQNRRARCKKEGVSLQRTATFATQLHIPKYTTVSPTLEPHRTKTYEADITHLPEDHSARERPANVLTLITRPTHSFPVPYPPFLDEDPFPVRSGVGTFYTPWLRRCAAESIQKSLEDIELLTAQMASLSLSSDASSSPSPIPSFAFVLPRAPLPSLIRMVTTSSRAQPLATLVSAAGSSSASRAKQRKPCRAPPTYLSVETQCRSRSSSPIMSSFPKPIPYRTSPQRRSRQSQSRSPSSPHSSRSSSSSSVASFRSSSSFSSAASSVGPLTPSTSPRIEPLLFAKYVSPPLVSGHAHATTDGDLPIYLSH